MKEPLTWRSLLGEVIAHPQERQRIAQILGVNPVSLTRWATGTSNPRAKHIHALLGALPHLRQQLLPLLLEEYPHFLADVMALEEEPLDVPSDFYAQVLDVYAHMQPLLRSSTIITLILKQILSQFDSQQRGGAVFILQCVPPAPGKPIRSLYIAYAHTTLPWQRIESHRQLFGIESQVGYAVQMQRPVTLSQSVEKVQLLPSSYDLDTLSSIAYPLLQERNAAGCLWIVTPYPQQFSDAQTELVSHYTNLLLLAFPSHSFYPFGQISLGVLPDFIHQRSFLHGFNERVKGHIITATRQGQILTRPQAELKVWQELERLLINPSPTIPLSS